MSTAILATLRWVAGKGPRPASPLGGDAMVRALGGLEGSRTTRRGWRVHPTLPWVEWKSGSDFRTAEPYLIVRLGGEVVARWWPRPGGVTSFRGSCPHDPREWGACECPRLGPLGGRVARGA